MNSTILQRYKRDLVLTGFSSTTQKTYYRNLVNFFKYTGNISIDDINADIIKDYLYHLIIDRKLSQSSLRQARCSITYFFSQTLNREMEVANIPCQKKEKKLPTFFTVDEVVRIVEATENIKHRTIFLLAYSSGLRVSEIVNLTFQDINRDLLRIAVHQGKGHKDRYALLSQACLEQLEFYWKTYHPQKWLFNGYKAESQLSTRAIQHAFKKAKENAGIKKQGGIHTLRHSFATHMLETGSGIFQLQKFLGHKHLKTTLVYAHIAEENTVATSPLDVFRDRFNHVISNC
jgi:integrase/recombinase XerD